MQELQSVGSPVNRSDGEGHVTGQTEYVDDVDALYAEFQEANVIHPNGPLEVKSWGMKEFVVLDLDGNALRIGQST